MEQDGRHPARAAGPELTAPTEALAPHLPAWPEPFHILESTDDGRRVIAPCGELDLATAAQLEERFAGSIDTVLDLSELSFIDSTGIRALLSIAHTAQVEAWELTIRNPQPAVLRAIQLVALEQHLGLQSQNGRHPAATTPRHQPARTPRSGTLPR
jgi:anti-sigma B factor antagonist